MLGAHLGKASGLRFADTRTKGLTGQTEEDKDKQRCKMDELRKQNTWGVSLI